MAAKYSSVPIIKLAHIITVYIVIQDIFFKLIRTSFYHGWRPLPFKFIYLQMLKNLLNNLIIFYKSDYPHPSPTFGTAKRIDFIYLLYKPRPEPIIILDQD